MKKNLTNEEFQKKYDNPFLLVSHAIKLAENLIRSGRAPRVETGTENPALQVLAEIAEGKDQFEEIPVKIQYNEVETKTVEVKVAAVEVKAEAEPKEGVLEEAVEAAKEPAE